MRGSMRRGPVGPKRQDERCDDGGTVLAGRGATAHAAWSRSITLATRIMLLGIAVAIVLPVAGCAAGTEADDRAGLRGSTDDADAIDADWIAARYAKSQHMIPMRDGVQLHTTIYRPRDMAEPLPFLMIRTPYSSRPYEPDAFPSSLGPSEAYPRDGYIFVRQDVRGTFMSEGEFVNMRPHIADKRSMAQVDESTDTYDTIEWLLENVRGHNGRVGQWGISYPGFYTAAGMIDAHPALVAASPQAPIADWWYDDFKHHGAFFMPHAFHFMSSFGLEREGPTTEWNQRPFEYGTEDGYAWYLDVVGTTRALEDDWLQGRVDFWTEMMQHPDRDHFWTSRDIVPHLSDVAPAVLVVGGWYDAEDLYGPLAIYRSVEAKNPRVFNALVMGPWRHGGWNREDGDRLGDVHFGEKTSFFYRAEIEKPFFDHYLKDGPDPELPEATVFETGRNQWRTFDAWPPRTAEPRTIHFHRGGALRFDDPVRADPSDMGDAFGGASRRPGATSFVSDPARPVPFTEDVTLRMTREYMVDDQRFAARRPDVLTFRSEPLEEAVTLAGPILARLWVSTSQDDADWVVKLIDQQPPDAEDWPDMRDGRRRSESMTMVRSEIIRGRYREDPARPVPFERNVPTEVDLPLQDVLHTFEPGHRIVIQIQSTWFPLVDRNPQQWVDNIFFAEADDYVAAEHRLHHEPEHPSRLEVLVLPASE